MKYKFIVLAFALAAFSNFCLAKDNYVFLRTIKLSNQSENPVTVPSKRIWKIEGLNPPVLGYKGIGTADFYIDGQIFVGEDRDYNIYGKFDVSVNNKQKYPLWVIEGSKISVGDSRHAAVIKEYEVK